MPGIGIISNPYAKVNKKSPEHNTLMWYVLGNKGQFEITNSLLDLSKVCLEFADRDIDVVGILGGDGTISLSLSALQKAYCEQRQKKLPKILILRGGTVNVLAQNLGIFGKPRNILDDFLQKYHGSSEIAETTLHSLVVNSRLGFLFANGIASRFLKEFYKNKTNAVGAGIFLGKTALDTLSGGRLNEVSKSILCEEIFDRKVDDFEVQSGVKNSLVLASTIPKMPFGIPLFRKLDCSKPVAEAHFFSATHSKLAIDTARIVLRQNPSAQSSEVLTFRSLKLQYKATVEYSLDGDLLESTDGSINIGVGAAFTFVSPYGKIL